jgi:hypothetical protein
LRIVDADWVVLIGIGGGDWIGDFAFNQQINNRHSTTIHESTIPNQ